MSASVEPIPPDARPGADTELRILLRDAAHPDGVRRLLGRLARRVDGHAVLLDRTGRLVHAAPETPSLAEFAADITRLATGRTDAVAVERAGHSARLLAVPAPDGSPDEPAGARRPVLVVLCGGGFPAAARALIADAVDPLALAWRAADADRRQRRLDRAEAQNREAVLHLLMVGSLNGARRAAAALGPNLPDPVRVYLVECADGAGATADRAARRATEASHGTAWVVRCPVYTRHVIVLAATADDGPVSIAADGDAGTRGRKPISGPASPRGAERVRSRPGGRADDPDDPENNAGTDAELERALHALATGGGEYHVGSGRSVPLRDVGVGYKQAFHALAVARHRDERHARFRPRGELADLVGPAGPVWAARVLAPLLSYRPSRRQDPDAQDLTATLASYLDFHTRATAQLKIHRNTLSARLRHVERLLGRDLSGLPAQAELYLALQFPGGTTTGDDTPTLPELLDGPDFRRWAELSLAPLRRADPRLLRSLRAWLDNDGQIEPTAAALGVSTWGLRKRLLRVEDLLGRSLLGAPSARYDLYLALRYGAPPNRPE